jgi:predicted phosphodiesterase
MRKKQRSKKKQTILVISDLHEPYSHPDTYDFLKACKKKFKPTDIVLSGDEVDAHAIMIQTLTYHLLEMS